MKTITVIRLRGSITARVPPGGTRPESGPLFNTLTPVRPGPALLTA
jgi:hypothetical protein